MLLLHDKEAVTWTVMLQFQCYSKAMNNPATPCSKIKQKDFKKGSLQKFRNGVIKKKGCLNPSTKYETLFL